MRNTTSIPSDEEKPHAKEKRPNSTIAVQNTVTVPNRLASHPVSGTVIASATE